MSTPGITCFSGSPTPNQRSITSSPVLSCSKSDNYCGGLPTAVSVGTITHHRTPNYAAVIPR